MKTFGLRPFMVMFDYIWRYKATRGGRYLMVAIIMSMHVAFASLGLPAFYLICALSGLAATAWLGGMLVRPKMSVTGRFPDRAVAGQPVSGRFRLNNLGSRPAYDLSAGYFGLAKPLKVVDADNSLDILPPAESDEVTVTILPRRRGLYSLPSLRAFSTFPLRICRTRVKGKVDESDTQEGSLLVLPDFRPVDHIDVPVNSRYQPGGVALTSQVGESPEYIGNREYRPGDSIRRLDYRSWARLTRPVVREFQEEYYCRMGLIIDTFVPGRKQPGPKGFPGLEAAISLSASVADALANGEYIIDIFAAGPELYVFHAGRHRAHFENILEILACVDACRTNPFGVVTPALSDELDNISTVIAVFLDWDRSRETLVRTALEAGCCVKVFIVRDGPTSHPYSEIEGVYDVRHFTPAEIANGEISEL